MSNAAIIASVALALLAVLLLGRGAAGPLPLTELVAREVLTPAQAELVGAGLPLDTARAIPDACARRCDVNVAREFPLVCDCPGDP